MNNSLPTNLKTYIKRINSLKYTDTKLTEREIYNLNKPIAIRKCNK